MDVLNGFFWLISTALYSAVWLVRFVLTLPLRLVRADRNRRKAHGSARWAHRWEQWWHGAVRGEGVLLGRGAFGRLLRFSSDGMVMVFAAMGAGKGLGVVIPSLLTYRGSMVVTDPKGENYAITRRQRARFGKVWMLNPTDLAHSERFNPLDMVRAGTPQEADDAEALARLLVVPDARESHWDDKATSLVKGLVLHVLHSEPAPSRTLSTVRRLSAGQRETFITLLTHIAGHSPSPAAREIIGGILTSAVDSGGDFSEEFQSILSNVQKATEPWSATSPAGKLSSSSTFRLSELGVRTRAVQNPALSSNELRTSCRSQELARDAQRSEAFRHLLFGVPGIDASEIYVLPTERRDVLEQIVRNMPALLPQMGSGTAEIDGVPVDDGADDQIEAGGPECLAVKGAVADFAALVEEDGALELVGGFALVETGLTAPAQRRARIPLNHEQGSLDTTDLAKRFGQIAGFR